MARAPQTSTRGGVTGTLLAFCLVGGGIGLAFDFANPGSSFWLLAAPGFRALLGAGAAIAVIAVGHLLRLTLGRRPKHGKSGRGGDADHA